MIFKKTIRIKSLLGYFSSSSQIMIKQKTIDRKGFVLFCSALKQITVDEKLLKTTITSFKQRFVFWHIKNSLFLPLWIFLIIASKRK